MDSTTWAFIDEYGNPNLATEKKDVSQFFIISVVILDSTALDGVRGSLEKVRREHFQTGEMKSKSLGKNRQRWVSVLTALADIPFKFCGLAVDKTAIDKTSGLQWKHSFYKHLCGRIYGKVMRAFPGSHVRADQYGSDEFKKSFATYIRANHQLTLFDRGSFEFVDSKNDVLVQLSDILCGLLARCYDPEKALPAPGELLKLVSDKALVIDEWPPRYRMTGGQSELAGSLDNRIATLALQRAEEFISNHEDAVNETVRCQVAILERLVLERRFGDDGSHLVAGVLLDNLAGRGLEHKGETWLRMNLIAQLRDEGMLITSSSAGYKLPASPADLLSFVRHAENICMPLLKRVVAACDAVKLATSGEVDVLSDPEQAAIARLIAALDDRRFDVE